MSVRTAGAAAEMDQDWLALQARVIRNAVHVWVEEEHGPLNTYLIGVTTGMRLMHRALDERAKEQR